MSSDATRDPRVQRYALGFDIDQPVSEATAAAAVQGGYQFCLRYVSLGATEQPSDLSALELQLLLHAGLCVMAVQHVLEPGWRPSASLGAEHGENAATHASNIGLPSGVCLWCDLEGVASNTPSSSVIAYVEAWAGAVQSAGFTPSLYVGYSCGLSGQQLYQDLSLQHYWRSMSDVPDVAVRGYQMRQSRAQSVINGLTVDVDQAGPDRLGGEVIWVTPQGQLGSP